MNNDQNINPENELDTTGTGENSNEKLPQEEEATDVAESLDELSQVKAELAEQKDKFLRMYSEFDNFRRRTAKEKLDLTQTASADLIKDLLPVIDDFQRAQGAIDKGSADIGAIKEGVALIYNKLFKVLEQKGLKPMDCVGQPFDSEFQEAITQIPAPSADLKGKVIDEVEKGYFLQDKVVRFAKVVIGA